MLCGKNREDVVLLAREMLLLDRRQFCSDCFQQCNQPADLAKNIFYYIFFLSFSLSSQDGVQDIVNIVNIVIIFKILNIVQCPSPSRRACIVSFFYICTTFFRYLFIDCLKSAIIFLAKTPAGMPERGKRGHISPFSFHYSFSFSVFFCKLMVFLAQSEKGILPLFCRHYFCMIIDFFCDL